MADIYTKSSCNIVTTCGDDPQEPLFQLRHVDKLQIGRIAGVKLGGKSQLWKELDAIVSDDYTRSELHNCKIYSRGWILQELLLAPRTLLFGKDQVHWKCGELEASEIWPDENPELTCSAMDAGFRKIDWTPKTNGYQDVSGHWYSLVERYSKLQLSKGEDKLVALSGIAKVVQRQTGDLYFAGNWESMMPYGLLWETRYGWLARGDTPNPSRPPPVHRLATYVAPSWSWASIDGPVMFPWYLHPWRAEPGSVDDKIFHDLVCNIERISLVSTGVEGDTAQKVTGGNLALRAPLVRKDAFQKLIRPTRVFPRLATIGTPTSYPDEQWIWDTESDFLNCKVHFAPIFVERWRVPFGRESADDSRTWNLSIHAMILVPANLGKTSYTREGAFHFHFRNGNPKYCKKLLDGAGLECLDESAGTVQAQDSSLSTLIII